METPRLIAELTRHHEAVLAHLAETRRVLRLPPDEALPLLTRRRWALVRLLRGYQLFKHVELFDPLIRRGGAPGAAAAAMKARCVLVGDKVSAHIRSGSSADVRGYLAAETAVIDLLQAHVAREGEEARRLVPAASAPAASPVRAAALDAG